MSSSVSNLLALLALLSPKLDFDAWYEPNPLDMGGFVVRAIQTQNEITKTFEVILRTDMLEPVEDLARSIMPYLEKGISERGARRFCKRELTPADVIQVIEASFPDREFHNLIGFNQWVRNNNINWNSGQAGTSDMRLGPLFSVATKILPLAGKERVIAGWYYESGILEIDFYPDYQDESRADNRIPLDPYNPEKNLEIVTKIR